MVIKILVKQYGFGISGQTGSHVRLSKMTLTGKIGTVVPLHSELKIGTLRGVLKLAKIDPVDFYEYL
ncbi:type II toxin-antitoxin system HicA family toxin [Methanocalculus sp.]|jgi:predicted RNA binding protein YcfA (HicA-like mRNA interferase family)|uniref:type II toxin-antitoxin system HicA family toxin n=1 Tax=Methanocalculus sp. TaxID=2004547 RepID=UPI0017E7DEB6|nr:type II toxin-antitoxin system HicA family toxin [Methanocalculus sp.]HIJ07380.1 type II toxin-antitoxin system HicA family toxin [Methanocalculus sp.]